MAQENEDGQEKTEDASEERRQEFRDRGEVAQSKELSSVFSLAAVAFSLIFLAPMITRDLKEIMVKQFSKAGTFRLNKQNTLEWLMQVWWDTLWVIIPICLVTAFVSIAMTFLQTRWNVSFKRMKPNFQKFNLIKGLGQLFSGKALLELFKGIGKMSAVSVVAWMILKSEWTVVPGLLNMSIPRTWDYWHDITEMLLWAVCCLLLLIAAIDYIYNYFSLERKMKMTKKEVREEFKRREVDPHVKARMRRMQQNFTTAKMLQAATDATVIVTNPTHYAVALKYDENVPVPTVLAKGVDDLALKIKEAGKVAGVPIVENKPLARALYKTLEVGEMIPKEMFLAVAEVIRYVQRLRKYGV